ncbi:MAG: ABC transporter ATP-binding protein [Ruminococcus sp.]|nr:ABC transporter ATP-binding protein [Ruminococcus sp.]MCD7799610.1 ABC transporter ATP-binding protein [Ruminococcus sp.]
MIEIENLTKNYGNIQAVKDISFTVNKNEVLGFLGPNGAGKSTTMNMIVGYLPMTSGTIKINGVDISENPKEAKKNIGYLPEIPPLYPDMKVIEYLKFVAGIKGIKKQDMAFQIDRAMSRLKITDKKNRVIKNLSKGYKQRVGFAQALLGDPKVIILDEPTVGLDPSQTKEVRDLIKRLGKDHTIIFSSHILSEVNAVADRILIINNGEIKAQDTTDNLEVDRNEVILKLDIEGDKDKVSDILGSIDGFIEILDTIEVSDGVYSYKVSIADDSVRKSIVSKLTMEDLSIMEITTMKRSLEDVFLDLTNNKK